MRGRRSAEKLGRDEKTVKQRQARRVEWVETALALEKRGPTPVGRTGAGQLYPPSATTHNY
ncbi:unknown [Bacteroides sp. CAG:709]|nr:unknown [Bacteroides sp. CAG:709]